MTRLRATLSTNPTDKAIAAKVDEAQRSLLAALRLCHDAKGSDLVSGRRVFAVRRDLQRALGALSDVRRIGTPYDTTDSDLTDTPTPASRPKSQPSAVSSPEVSPEE
jgi:hypothetical protein